MRAPNFPINSIKHMFGFSHTKHSLDLEIELANLDCVSNCLTDNSSKFSDFCNSNFPWL